ncbi:hypothetical protein PALS2_278 [Staphylococcus phage PALS_2]|nr:hypothetical protein PALS2_278 [Staphylococcus phage PALS_2]BDE75668.1 hypothetical protein [Staphylococcus phage S6]
MLMLLEEIVLFRQNRKEAKEKRIKEEKERERIRIKEEEREKEELLKFNERVESERKAREKATKAFLEKEGLIKSYFDRSENIDYQEAKQYLLRNGFNWSDLKRMNNYKIFLEANSLVEYKARKENVKIETIKEAMYLNKRIKELEEKLKK